MDLAGCAINAGVGEAGAEAWLRQETRRRGRRAGWVGLGPHCQERPNLDSAPGLEAEEDGQAQEAAR